ncbi:MAG: hypothetical protein NQU42_07455 [Methanothrix sp.]|uniref:hypothetical protein n=1 Tax=Methanothrix sp. TaxID=90426 RepID=UPI0025FE672C|nr:hypothetical protein [Methanothrix sp.]MCQ8903909.1 hypothetical protein [Methanothrix sp.]
MLSPVLLDIAAALIGAGILISVINNRMGSVSIGIGSVTVGVVLLSNVPDGWEIFALGFFGIAVLAGLWMISVGLKRSGGEHS